MNAPLYPEVLLRSNDDRQPLLPLTTDGVARWVWQGRFGSMLIEVVGDSVYVNGAKVVRHEVGRCGHRADTLG